MNKLFKKAAATALSMCMVVSMGAMSAFAANTYEDGDYTATVTMLHETKEQASMCNVLFDHDADITVKGDQAVITLYVANPVPGFPDAGADGTVKDVKVTLDGQQIAVASDIENKPMREMDETNVSFGVEDGVSIPCQVLSFTVPTAKLDAMVANPTQVDAFVNVAMMTDVMFRVKIENIKSTSDSDTSGAIPNENATKSMQITADVAAPEASYTVDIPEAIAMGTLSASEDNVTAYTVNVNATNLGTGKVVISTPAAGELASASDSLAYANSFGAQETSVSADLNGEFTVTAADVASASAGNYTGTVLFDISYFAGK